MEQSAGFTAAVRDYRYLLDREYPHKASLKIIGDRYRLSAVERTLLYRGVLATAASDCIREKVITSPPAGSRIYVDGYNVLLTVMNYRLGRTLCVATDGLVRDTGGVHGTILHRRSLFEEAAEALLAAAVLVQPADVTILFDAPVSHSRDHAAAVAKLVPGNLPVTVRLEKNSDIPLQQVKDGIVVTSDSLIALRCSCPVWDAAHTVIGSRWNSASLLDIPSILT